MGRLGKIAVNWNGDVNGTGLDAVFPDPIADGTGAGEVGQVALSSQAAVPSMAAGGQGRWAGWQGLVGSLDWTTALGRCTEQLASIVCGAPSERPQPCASSWEGAGLPTGLTA
jgi:hypothetical protein